MDLEWLRTELERPGRSQRGLADFMGLHPSQIARMLKGERRIQLYEIEKIEAYLGKTSSAPSLDRLRTKIERSNVHGLHVTRIASPGVWREDGTTMMLERIVVPSSPDPIYAGMPQFAIQIEGSKRFAICVAYEDRKPQPNELVAVERRNAHGLVETTICRLDLRDNGWVAALEGRPEVFHKLDSVSVAGKVIGIYEPTA